MDRKKKTVYDILSLDIFNEMLFSSHKSHMNEKDEGKKIIHDNWCDKCHFASGYAVACTAHSIWNILCSTDFICK